MNGTSINIMTFASSGDQLEIKPKILYDFGNGIIITDTMISVFLTVLILIIAAIIIRFALIPKWEKNLRKPKSFQLFIEWLVGGLNNNAHSMTGHNAKSLAPWYFTIVCFIFMGVCIEMLGFRPILSDLNVALTLSLSTFVLINVYGFKEKKLGRFYRYLISVKIKGKRIPVFVNPINIVTDSVVPVSMAIRMFGSVLSGYFIMHLLYSLPWWTHIGIPAIASVIFTLFHALIQSYVFMMLSLSFIAEATE